MHGVSAKHAGHQMIQSRFKSSFMVICPGNQNDTISSLGLRDYIVHHPLESKLALLYPCKGIRGVSVDRDRYPKQGFSGEAEENGLLCVPAQLVPSPGNSREVDQGRE